MLKEMQKQLQAQLETISTALFTLSQLVEQLSTHLLNSRDGSVVGETISRVSITGAMPRHPSGKTLRDRVFDIVKTSRKGITISQLQKKTGLSVKQLSNVLYKLKHQGLVESPSRGTYRKR